MSMQQLLDDLKNQLQRNHGHIILVGYTGCGKKNIGHRIAKRLLIPCIELENEIEKAAGRPIKDIIADFGMGAYQDGAAKVVERILKSQTSVLIINQSAYDNEAVQSIIADHGVTIWLNDGQSTLSRTGHSAYHDEPQTSTSNHPHANGDVAAVAGSEQPSMPRNSFDKAHLSILSNKGPCSNVVRRTLRAVARHVGVLKEHH